MDVQIQLWYGVERPPGHVIVEHELAVDADVSRDAGRIRVPSGEYTIHVIVDGVRHHNHTEDIGSSSTDMVIEVFDSQIRVGFGSF